MSEPGSEASPVSETPDPVPPARVAGPPPPPKERQHAFNALTDRFPAANLNTLVHFYRGELGRAVAWRQKMDMTTHWSIITVTALLSVCFTNSDSSHIIMIFASALVFLLLTIEGRRYRFYDVWRTRVRMLEVHFIVPSIAFEHRLLEGPWREQLCNDLLKPTYKISYWEAVSRRLQRNYIWLFGISFAGWLAKVYMDFHGRPVATRGSWWDAFNVYGIESSTEVLVPWWLVVIIAFGFHGYIVGLLIYAIRTRHATGEIRRKDPQQKQWPI